MRSFGARLAVALVAAIAGSGFVAAGAAGPLTAAADDEHEQLPIDHVVVLMQENRSFDSYFGELHFEGQPRSTPLPPESSNPNPTNEDAPPIKVFHKTALCEVADVNHSWTGTHQEIDSGRMDGFTAANAIPADPTGSRGIGFYDKRELPFYYALFSGGAPRPLDLQPAGRGAGELEDLLPGLARRVPVRLRAAARSWARRTGQPVLHRCRRRPAAQVSFVDPRFTGSNNVESDEHPPANVQVGEQFTASVISGLFKSPQWGSSALFLTYDEHGGFFDHVAPPRASVPDNIAPMLGPGDVNATFDRYGVRVPAVVVSPFAKRHFVSHRVHDHTSILRFIERRFGLPALTQRDAHANPMLEFFDFEHPSFARPPVLPAAPLDSVGAANCAALGSGSGGV